MKQFFKGKKKESEEDRIKREAKEKRDFILGIGGLVAIMLIGIIMGIIFKDNDSKKQTATSTTSTSTLKVQQSSSTTISSSNKYGEITSSPKENGLSELLAYKVVIGSDAFYYKLNTKTSELNVYSAKHPQMTSIKDWTGSIRTGLKFKFNDIEYMIALRHTDDESEIEAYDWTNRKSKYDYVIGKRIPIRQFDEYINELQ